MEDKHRLIASLAHWLALGKLESRLVLPAIQQLSSQGTRPETLLGLLEALETHTDDSLGALTLHLRETLRKEALRFYETKKQERTLSVSDSVALEGLCLEAAGEWRFVGDAAGPVDNALRAVRDLGFAIANVEKAPQLFREIKSRTSQALAEAQAAMAGTWMRML